MKSQGVRLVDVFLLGPWLVFLAFRRRAMTDPERVALAFVGAATVVYNARNYAAVQDDLEVDLYVG